MMDSGRRMGMAASQVRCTKLPGCARAAHFGRREAQHELVAVVGGLLDDARVLEEDGAAGLRGVMRACRASGQYCLEHRHAHGDAVAHLVADDRLRAVGDVGGDLDAAVHGLRVHDDGIRAGAPPGAPGSGRTAAK